MAYHNLRSKLDRAVVAYLVSVGAGGPGDTFPANSVGELAFPSTVVQSMHGNPDPVLTGNYRIRVQITIKGKGPDSDPNSEASRIAHDLRVSTVFDSLMQSDDNQTLRLTKNLINAAGRALAVPIDATEQAVQIAANNADMSDFTIIQWLDGGFGDSNQDQDGASWVEVLYFDALCCASNVD